MMDFSKMKWDIKHTPINKLLKTYPDLQIIFKEAVEIHPDTIEHSPLTPEEVMAFVVYTYHIKSPFAKETSIHKRRIEVLKELGFTIGNEKELRENTDLVQFIVGSNGFVNRLALHFCKLENSVDWIELCSLQEMLDDVYLTLKEETEGTDKKSAQEILKLKIEIRQKAQPFREQMRTISRELFSGDEEIINQVASHIILEKRKRLLVPEDIAKMPVSEVIAELKMRI